MPQGPKQIRDRRPGVSIIGTRGVPAEYGGFESVAEEIGLILVARGYDVLVYGNRVKSGQYQGIRLKRVNAIRSKSLETLTASFFASIHAIFHRSKIIMVMNLANMPFAALLWLVGKKVLINVDGLEWERKKWGRLAKFYFKLCAATITKLPVTIITDSKAIRDIYKMRYNRRINYLTYGARIEQTSKIDFLASLGLQPMSYFLVACRLEPENNTDLILREYLKSGSAKKLLILGDVHYTSQYVENLKSNASNQVIFAGAIYDQELFTEIVCNCFGYLHGHEVGGTNPSLLKAMGCGCSIMALDVQFNKEVLNDCGWYFSKEESNLAKKINHLEKNPGVRPGLGKKAQARIAEHYNWQIICDQYEDLFNEAV